MKRFHVHVHVADLPRNIAFYSAMFGQQPARSEADYAKWMLTDPQGIAWEQFHTLENIPVFNEPRGQDAVDAACCANTAAGATGCSPAATASRSSATAAPAGAAAPCCGPATAAASGPAASPSRLTALEVPAAAEGACCGPATTSAACCGPATGTGGKAATRPGARACC